MPHINSLTKDNVKEDKNSKVSFDKTSKLEKLSQKSDVSLTKQSDKSMGHYHKTEPYNISNAKADKNKAEANLLKAYVRVRIIDSSKENPKERLDKAPLYLEVVQSVEGSTNAKVQRIPLPMTKSFSGKEIRFDGAAIGNIMSRLDTSATSVLSGSTSSDGAKLGSNVSVHVPTPAGDFYFELEPNGDVKLRKIPSNLDVELSTYATVQTAKDLKCRELKVHAKAFHNQHQITAKLIEITADNKIVNSGKISADVIALKTIDAVNGLVSNVGGEIESKTNMDLQSAQIYNTAKITASSGRVAIEKCGAFNNAQSGEINIQGKLEGALNNLSNDGKISASNLKLNVATRINNTGTGSMFTAQIMDILTKEFINNGKVSSNDTIKCEADILSQNSTQSILECKNKVDLIISTLLKNAGKLSSKDLNLNVLDGNIENLLGGTINAEVANFKAVNFKNAGQVLINGKLEAIAKRLIENAGKVTAKDLQLTSVQGLIHNLQNALMLGDKANIHAATVLNQGDMIAKSNDFKITVSVLFENDRLAKTMSNGPLDIEATNIKNKGLLASASKNEVITKDLVDNQKTGVITSQACIAELCVNHSEKTDQALLKQILEGKESFGKDVVLKAGNIQNAGKVTGGQIALISDLKNGHIKNTENASIQAKDDIHIISKQIENAGSLHSKNGKIYGASVAKCKFPERPLICDKKENLEFQEKVKPVLSSSRPILAEKLLLQGTLPNSNTIIYFEEHQVAKDGSCGFHALGVSRKDVVELLLPYAKDEKIRNTLAPEINNALGGNDFGSAKTEESIQLYKKYNDCLSLTPKREAEANELIKQIDPNAKSRSLSNAIAYLKVVNNKEHAEILRRLENHLKFESDLEKAMQEYAASEAAFIAYVKSLGDKAWIGYKSASLVAKLKNMNLYIWTASPKNPKMLNLRESNVAASSNTIHMLHTAGFTHFNLLSEVAIKAKQENVKLQHDNEKISKDNTIQSQAKSLTLSQPGLVAQNLPAVVSKTKVDDFTPQIEPGSIFRNTKTGTIYAKDNIEVETFKLQNFGNIKSETQILFRGQKLSHLEGHLQAGMHVGIAAHHIKVLSDITAEANIGLRHGGGTWNVDDKLHATGLVHFVWPEARPITRTFTLDGGIHYELLPTAKLPLHILAHQLVKGDFVITAPTAVVIGNDQFYIHVGSSFTHACQKMTITAKDIYLWNGRMASEKRISLTSNNLALGRSGGPVYCSSAIGSNDNIEFNITNHIAWNYFEMYTAKNLLITASTLDNISSHVVVDGNAFLDAKSWHRLITTKNYGNGRQEGVVDPDAMHAYKVLLEQEYAISKPAHFEVRGKLINLKPLAVFASNVHYGEIEGRNYTPPETFIPYELWARFHMYGNPDRPWWRYFGDKVVGAPIFANLSVARKLTIQDPILKLSGNVSAGRIELVDILNLQIGVRTDLALPAPPPLRTCISLLGPDTRTSLFEVTGGGMYVSVFRPILPFQCHNEFGPILIVGADNHLRPNIHNRRCYYAALQERKAYVKVLMSELYRGCISHKYNGDPYAELYALRKSAEQLYRSGRTYVAQDGSIPVPFLVYKEISIINGFNQLEIALVPILYLPKTLEHSLLRDGYGGLFSFDGILIQGANCQDADLVITGTIETSGKLTFSTFNTVTQTTNMIKEKAYVVDTVEMSTLRDMRVKEKHTHREIDTYRKGRGNNIIAAEIQYQDISNVELRGTTMTTTVGGVNTQNVKNIEQTALLESRIEPKTIDIRTNLNNVTARVYQHNVNLVPTTINSAGPVRLKSQKGFYDNTIINGKLVKDASDEIIADELTIAKTPTDLAVEEAQRRVKIQEEREKAQDAEMAGIAKSLAIAIATAGTGTLVEGALSATALAGNTLAIGAVTGATVGAVQAVINKKNIFKEAAKGAALGGFNAGVKEVADKIDILKSADLLREGLQVAANAGANAIVNKTNFGQELVNQGARELCKELIPAASDPSFLSELGNNLIRNVVTTAIATTVNRGHFLAELGNTVVQSVGQTLGKGVGSQVGLSISQAVTARDLKDGKVNKEHNSHVANKTGKSVQQANIPAAEQRNPMSIEGDKGRKAKENFGKAITQNAQTKGVLVAAYKKADEEDRRKSYHCPRVLLDTSKMAAENFLSSDIRYTPPQDYSRSGSASTRYSKNVSNVVLHDAMKKLPLRGLRFIQSPADVVDEYGYIYDVSMSQRQQPISIKAIEESISLKNMQRENLGNIGRYALRGINAINDSIKEISEAYPLETDAALKFADTMSRLPFLVVEGFVAKQSDEQRRTFQNNLSGLNEGFQYVLKNVRSYFSNKYDEYGLNREERVGANSLFAFGAFAVGSITKTHTIKSRLKAAQLPTRGKLRFVPDTNYRPTEPLLKTENFGFQDKFGNVWTKGPSRTVGEAFEWDVQLSALGKKQLGWLSRDCKHINVSLSGKVTHR